MKTKSTTFILIIVVIGVWGYVIYKVFQAIQADDTIGITNKKRTIVQEELSYYSLKIQDSLNLNFRDPIYYKDESKQKVQPSNEKSESNYVQDNYIPPIMEPEINILYLGFIENEKSKKKTAIVQIDGNQYMLSLHEGINGIKLLDIKRDFIRMQHKNKVKTIFK